MGHDPIEDTAEYVAWYPGAATERLRRRHVPVEVDIAALSHPGKVRPINEDHYLVVRAGRFLETRLTNLPQGLLPDRFEEVIHALAVADGLGGMPAGEVASRQAIAVLVDLVLDTPDWVFGLDEPDVARILTRAVGRFRDVDGALVEYARRDPTLEGMGTTLTVVWNLGPALFVAHVGDSRAYLLRAGTLRKLTRDHTRAQELADVGLIAEEDVATHRLRHVLTQALGIWKGDVEPDIVRVGLEDGDRLLVCTDGLTLMVDETTIAAEMEPDRNGSADQVCQSLLELTLERGAADNVTIAVAGYRIAAGT